ncbi:hypothetical protein Tco_0529778 [Tanacetum coccineum]
MQILKFIFKGWFGFLRLLWFDDCIIEMCLDSVDRGGQVMSEQDELPSSVGLDFRARLDGDRMYSGHLEAKVEVTKLTTSRLVNGSSCDGIDIVIKNLDLEPKVYAMMRDFLEYLVNIVQLLNPLPEGWSIRTGAWRVCLGEGEDDAFVVINLSGKVVKYNLISKTNTEIFDIGSNQMDDDDDDDAVLFIPPFEVDPNLYEFIPSLASV